MLFNFVNQKVLEHLEHSPSDLQPRTFPVFHGPRFEWNIVEHRGTFQPLSS
jgi:hypothetical protein